MYQLNMAREQVLPLEKRKRWIRWVLAYLIAVVVLISAVVYHLTVHVVALSARSDRLAQEELLFLKNRPGTATMDDSLKKITGRKVELTAELNSLVQFNDAGVKSANVVLGLAESLPVGVDLGRVALDGAVGTLSIDVYVPSSAKMDGNKTLPSIIALWEKSPLLTNQISQMTSENSERVNLEGQDFLSSRFSGVLEKGFK